MQKQDRKAQAHFMNKDFSKETGKMTYSYSRLNSYNTCPYGFKLTYIDKLDRDQNAFAEYGLLVHEILEKMWLNKIDYKDMVQEYKDNYEYYLLHNFPPFPKGMNTKYYDAGLDFFQSVDLNKDDFNVIMIEDTIYHTLKGIDLVVKPDAIIQEKSSGKHILLDYKTSKLYGNSYDDKKIEKYLIQMSLYSYILWLENNIEIQEIWIWFIRNQEIKKFKFDENLILKMIDWLESTYQKIQSDTEWVANNGKKNKYFCTWLCGVSHSCPYKPK